MTVCILQRLRHNILYKLINFVLDFIESFFKTKKTIKAYTSRQFIHGNIKGLCNKWSVARFIPETVLVVYLQYKICREL